MNKTGFASARRRLLERQAVLSERERAFTLLETQVLPKLDDNGPGAMARRMLSHQRVDEAERLRRVREALERMEQGRYGVCVACGRAIEDGRLSLSPEADRCGGCVRQN